MWECPNNKSHYIRSAVTPNYCPECGAKLVDRKLILHCAHCGQPVLDKDKYCQVCGKNIES